MRLIAALAAAVLVSLGLAAPSRAGLLELPFDSISRYRACESVPCIGNSLVRKRVFVHDRWLSFDVRTRPAHYALRKVRVMVAPPGVVVSNQDYDTGWANGYSLVEVPAGPTRVVKPAQYEWVMKEVLVSPGMSYVARRQPHYAYYPETIYVSEP